MCPGGAPPWCPSSTTPPTTAGSPGRSSRRSAHGCSGGRSPRPRSGREAAELSSEVLAGSRLPGPSAVGRPVDVGPHEEGSQHRRAGGGVLAGRHVGVLLTHLPAVLVEAGD